MQIICNGKNVLVDEIDLHILKGKNLKLTTTKGYPYLLYYHNGGRVFFHRIIMDAAPGVYVDHINGDTLDNRRVNLRICSHSENMTNRKKHSHSNHLYKGIDKREYPKKTKWRARIRTKGIRTNGPWRDTQEEAAMDYAKLSIIQHKEFSRVNELISQ